MKHIKKYLTEKELRHIPFLLGKDVYQIYSKTISVDLRENQYEARSFSLSTKGEFVCFETRWIDKPDYEFYKLRISKRKSPIEVKMVKMRGSERKALYDPSKILMTPASNIKKIELYSTCVEDVYRADGSELKAIYYDSSFLFTQEDSQQFLIGINASITDTTFFIRDPQAIEKRLREYREEKRLEWC